MTNSIMADVLGRPVHVPGGDREQRASGGPSILLGVSNEHIAVAMDDALRLSAAAVGVEAWN
jgi:hypothetical protein